MTWPRFSFVPTSSLWSPGRKLRPVGLSTSSLQ